MPLGLYQFILYKCGSYINIEEALSFFFEFLRQFCQRSDAVIDFRTGSCQFLQFPADTAVNGNTVLLIGTYQKNQILGSAVSGIDISTAQGAADGFSQLLRTVFSLALILNHFAFIINQRTQHEKNRTACPLHISAQQAVGINKAGVRTIIRVVPLPEVLK